MENKDTLISYSIVILFFVLMITSAFLDDPTFYIHTRVLLLPTIFFSISTILMSTIRRIIRRFQAANRSYVDAIPYTKLIFAQMTERKDFAVENDVDWEDEAQKTFQQYQVELKTLESNIALLSKAINRASSYKIITIMYVVSFSLLLICIALSPILVDLLSFVSIPFVTLLALFITVSNAVLGDWAEEKWANSIIDKVKDYESLPSK